MGAWLAPVSRVLTHASASLRRLDREAGIITLLLDESPSLGLTATVDGTRERLGVSVLMPRCKSLKSCETSTCFGSCKPRVTEPQRIERICLLKLEARDLVSESDGGFIEVVITLDVGTEAPVVEEMGFDHEGRERGGLRAQELDEPIGEDVGIGLDGDNGIGEEGVEEELLVFSSQGATRVLSPFDVLNEGGLYGLPVDGANDKVGEAAVVGLKPLGALSESDESGECGGVVACSYVGKSLLEGCHLLSPHPVGEGVLGFGGVEVCPPLVRLTLGLFEGGLGHLLSQYGSKLGGETIPKLLELGIAGGRGDGEIWVKEVVDEGVVKSRGDLQRRG